MSNEWSSNFLIPQHNGRQTVNLLDSSTNWVWRLKCQCGYFFIFFVLWINNYTEFQTRPNIYPWPVSTMSVVVGFTKVVIAIDLY